MIRLAVGILLMTVCTRLAVPAPTTHHAPRYSDVVCLAWVVDDEARGEPLRGQRAVYDVVKHRMTVRKKTACEVVMEPGQFSGYHKGMHLYVDDLMLTRINKVRKMAPVVPNAEYFHATYVAPTWANRMKRKLKIGLHVFYEQKPKQKEKQK